MRNHQKHKKIFYVPGMISLVLLPLMCLYYFYENKSFYTHHSFQLILNDTSFNEKPKKEMFGNDFYNPKRNYKSIFLNGPEELDETKLKKARVEIKQIYNLKDSINGVKFIFGKQTTYETFINLQDMLTIDDIEYLNYTNEVYTLYVPKSSLFLNPKPERAMFCIGDEVLNLKLKKENLERELEKKYQQDLIFFKQKWQILLAFLGIVILNIFALVKFNKNRKFNQKTYI